MGSKEKIHVTWWQATAGPSESDATHNIIIMQKPRALSLRAWPMTFTDGGFHHTGEMTCHPDKKGTFMFNGEWTNITAILLSWGLVQKTKHEKHEDRGSIRVLEEIKRPKTKKTDDGWIETRNLRAHSLHGWNDLEISGPPVLSKSDASNAFWVKWNKNFPGLKVKRMPSLIAEQMDKDAVDIFDFGDSVFS